MTGTAKSLAAFLGAWPQVALATVADAAGSTPREQGAWMLISSGAIFGTIGGGQLEFMTIDRARALLSEGLGDHGARAVSLDIPLGPEIGQCCGGHVEIDIRPVDTVMRATLLANAEADDKARPHVYLFGGGHVGHALASAFALLPIQVIVVETRSEALLGMPDTVETRLTPVPEQMVRSAPPASAFVVMTHDHALDFLIVAEALKREDAAYVGMIGSKTKRAVFRNWFTGTAGGAADAVSRLVSPIGGASVKDKRPAVIAALAAAEIMTALLL